MVGHVARMGKRIGSHRTLAENLEGRSPLGRPRRRWVKSIEMHIQELGWGHGIDVVENSERWRAVVGGVMNLLVL